MSKDKEPVFIKLSDDGTIEFSSVAVFWEFQKKLIERSTNGKFTLSEDFRVLAMNGQTATPKQMEFVAEATVIGDNYFSARRHALHSP